MAKQRPYLESSWFAWLKAKFFGSSEKNLSTKNEISQGIEAVTTTSVNYLWPVLFCRFFQSLWFVLSLKLFGLPFIQVNLDYIFINFCFDSAFSQTVSLLVLINFKVYGK